jgi:hypothetical protein
MYISARKCDYDAPLEYMGQEFDWPLRSLKMGTVAEYTCPIYKATEAGLGKQYTRCIWDKETDEMIWEDEICQI